MHSFVCLSHIFFSCSVTNVYLVTDWSWTRLHKRVWWIKTLLKRLRFIEQSEVSSCRVCVCRLQLIWTRDVSRLIIQIKTWIMKLFLVTRVRLTSDLIWSDQTKSEEQTCVLFIRQVTEALSHLILFTCHSLSHMIHMSHMFDPFIILTDYKSVILCLLSYLFYSDLMLKWGLEGCSDQTNVCFVWIKCWSLIRNDHSGSVPMWFSCNHVLKTHMWRSDRTQISTWTHWMWPHRLFRTPLLHRVFT